jgi:uncharacterized protein (DUF433 family)
MSRLAGRVAVQFAEDVSNGVSDDELLKKYSISSKKSLAILKLQVRRVLKEMAEVKKKVHRSIDRKGFLKDLNEGLSNEQLIEKYDLKKERHLQQLFRKLVERGDLDIADVTNRLCVTQSQVREAFKDVQDMVKELD